MGFKMQLQERSYGGKLFRPRPEIFVSDDKKLFVLATPWGPRKMAQAFIEKLSTELQDLTIDPDRTFFSLPLDTLSEQENRLRLALLSIHEDLREDFNSEDLTSGLEIFCLFREEKRVSWFQIGSPFVAILRGSQCLPLCHPLDLSFDHSTTTTLPPLPKELYGLSQHLSMMHGNFLQKRGDQLLFIARSYVPYETFQLPSREMSLEKLTQILSQENVDQPFWLGLLEVD